MNHQLPTLYLLLPTFYPLSPLYLSKETPVIILYPYHLCTHLCVPHFSYLNLYLRGLLQYWGWGSPPHQDWKDVI